MKVNFNRDWDRRTIRNMVKNNCFLEFGKHADLRAICINEEDFTHKNRDWIEMAFVVPTKWLKEFCKKEFGVDDLDYWLSDVYTSDESEIIFENALEERQVVMVDF